MKYNMSKVNLATAAAIAAMGSVYMWLFPYEMVIYMIGPVALLCMIAVFVLNRETPVVQYG